VKAIRRFPDRFFYLFDVQPNKIFMALELIDGKMLPVRRVTVAVVSERGADRFLISTDFPVLQQSDAEFILYALEAAVIAIRENQNNQKLING